jgi:hypothetical protein
LFEVWHIGHSLGLSRIQFPVVPFRSIQTAPPSTTPFNEIIARYLKAIGDPRKVVADPEARYWGGRVEEHSLVPSGEARLGRICLDEWLRRSSAAA